MAAAAESGFDPIVIFLWLGYLGAWLLFAGPVYQAATELREQGFSQEEGERLRQQVEALPSPPRIHPLWWLLPPVAYFLSQRRSRQWRAGVYALLDDDGRERFVAFQNKAAGWLVVGSGAVAIAAKETAELIEHYAWSWWLLLPMLVVPFLLSVGWTVNRLGREREIKALAEPDSAAPRPRRRGPRASGE